MARNHAADVLYRAVVTRVRPERTLRDGRVVPGETFTQTFGPYEKEGTARAQVTRESKWNAYNDEITTSVEVGHVTWEPVG